MRQSNQARFDKLVGFKLSADDCWIWGGTCFKRKRKRADDRHTPAFWESLPNGGWRSTYARRWAWEQKHGPIEKGEVVINVCGEELCVNPDNVKHNICVPKDQLHAILAKFFPKPLPQTDPLADALGITPEQLKRARKGKL